MPTTANPTASMRVSAFIAGEASGSDLTQNPVPGDSGYPRLLEQELRRIGLRGGTVHLDAESLVGLAEFCETMEIANAQGYPANTSGARSCAAHAEKARRLARELEN